MDHSDHVRLLRPGIFRPGGVWADFGSGTGAFTLALAELIQPDGEIFSIDQDRPALRRQEKEMRDRFPRLKVEYLHANYAAPIDLPALDGIVAANTLHFQADQMAVIERLHAYLKPGGRMIVVEYNINHSNSAVPFPLPYVTWERLAKEAGFSATRLLATRPSRFLKEIYSALSTK
jgi:ubiquinone/menaquinone biosynthesis C-methylase UbiE